MPSICKTVDVDVDIDLDDFDDDELIEELDFHGYINKETAMVSDKNMGIMESMFVEKMSKLSSCYYRLTPEEEKTLETLFKKYV